MKKRGKIKKILFLALVSLFLVMQVSFCFASFTLHNEDIKRQYVGGEQISGKINLSLRSEPFNSSLKSNFIGESKLIDFLIANGLEEGVHFNCTINGCGKFYSAKSSISSEEIDNEKNLLVGFKIRDSDVYIRNLDFSLSSNLESSCSQPLKIFILGENETFITNNNYVSNVCGSKNFGCFQNDLDSDSYQQAIIIQEDYCERISLNPSPAYIVGAEITASGNSSSLIFSLFNDESEQLKSCSVTNIPLGKSTVQCIINQSILERGDYYVCVSANSNKNEYQIRSEKEQEICGGAGLNKNNRDYEIFAQAVAYAPIQNLSIAKAYRDIYKMNLGERADEYIADNYNRDCSKGDGCVIPFLITGASQRLNFENISLLYEGSGAVFTKKELYMLEEKASLISTNNPVILDISYANFTIPISSKAQNLQILLGEMPLFKTDLKINITPGFGFDIYPTNAIVGIETNLFIVCSQNLTNIQWEFSDGTKRTTRENTLKHTFLNAGEYSLKVSATNQEGITFTKTFVIKAENVTKGAEILLNQSKERLNSLQRSMDLIGEENANLVKREVNITQIQNELKEIEEDYKNASSEEEYIKVIKSLLNLNIPKEVKVINSGEFPLSVGLANVDVGYVESLLNSSIISNKKDKFEDTLIYWNHNAFSGKVRIDKIVLFENELDRTLFSIFNISVQPVAKLVNKTYLIVDYPYEEIVSSSAKGFTLQSGISKGSAFEIDDKKEIELVIADEIEELGFYLAPDDLSVFGSEFVVGDENGDIIKSKLPTQKLILYVVLLIVGFFVVYIILQEWYKRNYEKHLFKNPDELYNLVHFINNSRKIGIVQEEIKKKLLGAGWSREQITYATKKLDGKRTGMFEIPVFRYFEKQKVKEELAKRGS